MNFPIAPIITNKVREHLMMNSDSTDYSYQVPSAVIGRLSLYLREIQQLDRLNKETVSSRQLGKNLGISDAQVRKDFAYFGQFGLPGVGYRCKELIQRIKEILGTDRIWPVALVGCGHLGRALLGYRGFADQGLSVVAAFDSSEGLIGKQIAGLTIDSVEKIPEVVKHKQIRLAILSVPADAARPAAEQLVAAGISGILNFAPVTLMVPKRVSVIEVDLASELEQLVFRVAQGTCRRSSDEV